MKKTKFPTAGDPRAPSSARVAGLARGTGPVTRTRTRGGATHFLRPIGYLGKAAFLSGRYLRRLQALGHALLHASCVASLP